MAETNELRRSGEIVARCMVPFSTLLPNPKSIDYLKPRKGIARALGENNCRGGHIYLPRGDCVQEFCLPHVNRCHGMEILD